MTGSGYRWIDAAGAPCSPRHRSPVTAARWLARRPRRPRVTARPVTLLAEREPRGRASRRRPLSAAEREQLVAELARTRGAPASAAGWVARQTHALQARKRRRAALKMLTGRVAAHHPERRRINA